MAIRRNAWVEEHTPTHVSSSKWDDEDAQVDFAYSFEGVGRFRVNAFHQRGLVSIVMRHIKSTRADVADQLKLGEKQNALIKMAQAKDGILLDVRCHRLRQEFDDGGDDELDPT